MTDHAIDEWIEKAIPPGSGRYYALLHSDNNALSLRAITTLISIWSRLGFTSRETEVARRKLDWWRNELQGNDYQHPVTIALQPYLVEHPDLLSQLNSLLDGYGSLLRHGSPSTEQANHTFHKLTGGAACTALCGSQLSETDKLIVSRTGIVLSQIRCLRYLRQHVANGLLCLPIASLEQAGISPQMLTADNTSTSLKNYLTSTLSAVNTELQTLLNELIDCHNGVKPVFIYSQLQHQLVNVMLKDNANPLQQEIRLTPIKNYWHAFKAARRFHKARPL